MRLKKAERELVRMKYGGHCAYCGIELGAKWHADHLAPVVRELLSKQTPKGGWKLVSGKPLRPEHDVLENMMPACAPCNISKGGQSLEGWRSWIAGHVNSLNSYHPIYRLAKAYGLVIETAAPVVFYFEKVQTSACGYTYGDWECREGGYLWYAGDGDGYDASDCTHICPHCRTADYLEAAKEDAEGCSSWMNNGTSGTGLDLWLAAEKRALSANESAARIALSQIGAVHALEGDDSPDGYSVVLCNTQAEAIAV